MDTVKLQKTIYLDQTIKEYEKGIASVQNTDIENIKYITIDGQCIFRFGHNKEFGKQVIKYLVDRFKEELEKMKEEYNKI